MKQLFIISLAMIIVLQTNARLIIYNMPKTAASYSSCTLSIRESGTKVWKKIFVNDASVGSINQKKHCGFSYFDSDFSKNIEVNISLHNGEDLTDIIVDSYQDKISYKVVKNNIRFVIKKEGKFSIVLGKKNIKNIYLIANPIENLLDKKSNFTYFGPGIHNIGPIELKNNQKIYIDGGAIVYATLHGKNVNNASILGRGILDGTYAIKDPNNPPKLFNLENCNNVTISGITLRNSPSWNIGIFGCKFINVLNINEFSNLPNSDGIDVCNSSNVTIENICFRNYDDNISIKSFNEQGSSNITVKNCLLYADRGHNMVVGPEMRNATIENIFFKDICVLGNHEQNKTYSGVMSVMCADNGIINNVSWERIVVNNNYGESLINIGFTDVYSKLGLGKKISNIKFDSVTINDNSITKIRIIGLDKSRTSDSISLKNFRASGNHYKLMKINRENNIILKDLIETNSHAFYKIE